MKCHDMCTSVSEFASCRNLISARNNTRVKSNVVEDRFDRSEYFSV